VLYVAVGVRSFRLRGASALPAKHVQAKKSSQPRSTEWGMCRSCGLTGSVRSVFGKCRKESRFGRLYICEWRLVARALALYVSCSWEICLKVELLQRSQFRGACNVLMAANVLQSFPFSVLHRAVVALVIVRIAHEMGESMRADHGDVLIERETVGPCVPRTVLDIYEDVAEIFR
jgi:hypothetical protein